MPHVMLDLETYGTAPGCPVLAIGAVAFTDPSTPRTFYGVAHQHQGRLGLFPEPETIRWWKEQSEEARAIFNHPDAVDIRELLKRFAEWLPADALVWGNGAGFDQPILGHAYIMAGRPIPWKFYNERCYRTIKNMAPEIRLERKGTHHNALDDASSQADHLLMIAKTKGWALA